MTKTLSLLLGLMVSLWVGVAAAAAQTGYPQPGDTYINDYAHVLTSTDAANITQLLAELKSKNGIEATVVTINSIHDYSTGDKTIETFATHLFNTWGVGSKADHKGVLILVAVKDRKMRIELGTGYESQYNDDMQQVINEHMLPAFKQGNYSRGLYQGTRAVVATLTGSWPADKSPAPAPAKSGNVTAPVSATASSRSAWSVDSCLVGLVALLVLYHILAYIFGWPMGSSGSSERDRNSWSSSSRSSSSSSSSSSGSSFGGGRSSGGGASGSW